MSKEKQTNEITKIIARRSMAFRNPNVAFMTTARKTADSIYNAGYRKQREIAMEIFDEIERTFKGLLNGDISNILKLLSTLKNEYVEKKLDEAEKALNERKEDEGK